MPARVDPVPMTATMMRALLLVHVGQAGYVHQGTINALRRRKLLRMKGRVLTPEGERLVSTLRQLALLHPAVLLMKQRDWRRYLRIEPCPTEEDQ